MKGFPARGLGPGQYRRVGQKRCRREVGGSSQGPSWLILGLITRQL